MQQLKSVKMPVKKTPVIPDEMVSLMKGLAKNVLKEHPDNLYEYAAKYFENLLLERDGSLNKGYEQSQSYSEYVKRLEKSEKNQLNKQNHDMHKKKRNKAPSPKTPPSQMRDDGTSNKEEKPDMTINGTAIQVVERPKKNFKPTLSRTNSVPLPTKKESPLLKQNSDSSLTEYKDVDDGVKRIDAKDENLIIRQSSPVMNNVRPRKLSSRKPSETLIAIKEESLVQDDEETDVFEKTEKEGKSQIRKGLSEQVAALIIQRSIKLYIDRLKKRRSVDLIKRFNSLRLDNSLTDNGNENEEIKNKLTIEESGESKVEQTTFNIDSLKGDLNHAIEHSLSRTNDDANSNNNTTVDFKETRVIENADNLKQDRNSSSQLADDIRPTEDDENSDEIDRKTTKPEYPEHQMETMSSMEQLLLSTKDQINNSNVSNINTEQTFPPSDDIKKDIIAENNNSDANNIDNNNSEEIIQNETDEDKSLPNVVNSVEPLAQGTDPLVSENEIKEHNTVLEPDNLEVDSYNNGSLTPTAPTFSDEELIAMKSMEDILVNIHLPNTPLILPEHIKTEEENAKKCQDEETGEFECTSHDKQHHLDVNVDQNVDDFDNDRLNSDGDSVKSFDFMLREQDEQSNTEENPHLIEDMKDQVNENVSSSIDDVKNNFQENSMKDESMSAIDITNKTDRDNGSLNENADGSKYLLSGLPVSANEIESDTIKDVNTDHITNDLNIETKSAIDTEQILNEIINDTINESTIDKVSNDINKLNDSEVVVKELIPKLIDETMDKKRVDIDQSKVELDGNENSVVALNLNDASMSNNISKLNEPDGIKEALTMKEDDRINSENRKVENEKEIKNKDALAVNENKEIENKCSNQNINAEDPNYIHFKLDQVEDKPNTLDATITEHTFTSSSTAYEVELAETSGITNQKNDPKIGKITKSTLTLDSVDSGMSTNVESDLSHTVKKEKFNENEAAFIIQRSLRTYKMRRDELAVKENQSVLDSIISEDILTDSEANNLGAGKIIDPLELQELKKQNEENAALKIQRTYRNWRKREESKQQDSETGVLNKTDEIEAAFERINEATLQDPIINTTEKVDEIFETKLEGTVQEENDDTYRNIETLEKHMKLSEDNTKNAENLENNTPQSDNASNVKISNDKLESGEQDQQEVPNSLSESGVAATDVEDYSMEDKRQDIMEKETLLNLDKTHNSVLDTAGKYLEEEKIFTNVTKINPPDPESIKLNRNSKSMSLDDSETREAYIQRAINEQPDPERQRQHAAIVVTRALRNWLIRQKNRSNDKSGNNESIINVGKAVAAVTIQRYFRGWIVRRPNKNDIRNAYSLHESGGLHSIGSIERQLLEENVSSGESSDKIDSNSEILSVTNYDSETAIPLKSSESDDNKTNKKNIDVIESIDLSNQLEDTTVPLEENDAMESGKKRISPDPETVDISSFDQNSLEAMYYSIRKNDIMADKIQKQSKEQLTGGASEIVSTMSEVREVLVPKNNLINLSNTLEEKCLDKIPELVDNIKHDTEDLITPISKTAKLFEDTDREIAMESILRDPVPIEPGEYVFTDSKSELSQASQDETDHFDPNHSLTKKNEEFRNRLDVRSQRSYTIDVVSNRAEESFDADDMDWRNRIDLSKYALQSTASETDSDILDANAGLKRSDLNVSTALDYMTSTDTTDSSSLSAVTKIHAGRHGYKNHRPSIRSSVGTSYTSGAEYHSSVGNAAIDESMEYLIESEEKKKFEVAVLKIQRWARTWLEEKFRKSDRHIATKDHENFNTKDIPSSGDSNEEVQGVIGVVIESRPPSYKKVNSPRFLKAQSEQSGSSGSNEPQLERAQTTSVNYEDLDTAGRRLLLQRGVAVQGNSTPEDSQIINLSNEKPLNSSSSPRRSTEELTAEALKTVDKPSNIKESNNCVTLKEFSINRRRRQSMPVQIDMEIMRIRPKHMKKRIRSADIQALHSTKK